MGVTKKTVQKIVWECNSYSDWEAKELRDVIDSYEFRGVHTLKFQSVRGTDVELDKIEIEDGTITFFVDG